MQSLSDAIEAKEHTVKVDLTNNNWQFVDPNYIYNGGGGLQLNPFIIAGVYIFSKNNYFYPQKLCICSCFVFLAELGETNVFEGRISIN